MNRNRDAQMLATSVASLLLSATAGLVTGPGTVRAVLLFALALCVGRLALLWRRSATDLAASSSARLGFWSLIVGMVGVLMIAVDNLL